MSRRTDEPRLLAQRSELGYVRFGGQALAGEPEAVDEATQERFALAARRARDEQLRAAWALAHGQIDSALRTFEEAGRPDSRTLSDARAIERTAARIDKRLGL